MNAIIEEFKLLLRNVPLDRRSEYNEGVEACIAILEEEKPVDQDTFIIGFMDWVETEATAWRLRHTKNGIIYNHKAVTKKQLLEIYKNTLK